MNHAGARRVKKKHKKRNRLHKEKYLFVHFTDTDIEYYSPRFYDSLEDAQSRAKTDIMLIAIKEGYKLKDVFKPNIKEVMRRIEELWEV